VTQRRLLASYRTSFGVAQPGTVLPVDTRVVERCAYCGFTTNAPLEQAREAFQAHRCDRPQPVKSNPAQERICATRATRLTGS
jgi:hypothetical protein